MTEKRIRKIGFQQFYREHTPLFLDLLRDIIIKYLTNCQILKLRRVCKNFEKMVENSVIPRLFDSGMVQSSITQQRNLILLPDNEEKDKKCVQLFDLQLKKLRFKHYRFRGIRSITTFLIHLEKRIHNQRIRMCSFTFDGASPFFRPLELYSLLELRRYKSIGCLAVYLGKCGEFSPIQPIEQVAEICKISKLSLEGFSLGGNFGSGLEQLSICSFIPSILADSTNARERIEKYKYQVAEMLKQVQCPTFMFQFRFYSTQSDEGEVLFNSEFHRSFSNVVFKTLSENECIKDLACTDGEYYYCALHVDYFMLLLRNNQKLERFRTSILVATHDDLNKLSVFLSEIKNSPLRIITIEKKFSIDYRITHRYITAICNLIKQKDEDMQGKEGFFHIDFSLNGDNSNTQFFGSCNILGLVKALEETLKKVTKKLSFNIRLHLFGFMDQLTNELLNEKFKKYRQREWYS